MKKYLILLLSIFIAGLFAGVAFIVIANNTFNKKTKSIYIKTYKNQKFGFKINIPNNWQINEHSAGAAFYSPNTAKLIDENDCSEKGIIEKKCSPDGYAPDLAVSVNKKSEYDEKSTSQSKNIFLGKNEFHYFVTPGMMNSFTYEIKSNNDYYDFITYSDLDAELSKIMASFEIK
jgi:hypothetical protein